MDPTKFIIYNYTNISDEEAFEYILRVIHTGKISKTSLGEQYCFATRFNNIVVICSLNKNGTHKFQIVLD